MDAKRQYSILYVDDEEANLLVFKTAFRKIYDLHFATSGEEGLKILKQHQIDLVISDQRMPGMLGTEFLEKVMEMRPHCMRMIITGYSDLDAVVASINRCGIFRYISKPWRAEELIPAISSALETYQLRIDKEWLFDELRKLNVSLEERLSMHIDKLNDQTEALAKLNQELTDANQSLSASESRLMRINKSKDRILATVAHDLRNPINNIQGLSNILKLQRGKDLSPMDKDIFARITGACKKALSLISELLEISEMENDEYVMETTPTVIEHFLREAITAMERGITEKGINLYINLSCNQAKVQLNAGKFTRVIENLVTNAQKFTDEGGSITVSCQRAGRKVCISIADTGIGIPREMQPIIFEKFSKAGRTGLKGEKSTGLGMSIVKQVLDLHHGEISFESEENRGTTFYIELPIFEEGGNA